MTEQIAVPKVAIEEHGWRVTFAGLGINLAQYFEDCQDKSTVGGWCSVSEGGRIQTLPPWDRVGGVVR